MCKQERRELIRTGLRVKDDCFAYKKQARKCNALNDTYCRTEKCLFYKTEKQRCEECKATRTLITCSECKARGLK